jgi:MFS family permease
MSEGSGSQKALEVVDTEKTHAYSGSGTSEDPFIVEFLKNDKSNPMNWGQFRKWFLTAIVTFSVFAVTFASSAYSVSAQEIKADFDISTLVFITGVSVFVLGFAIGPAVWGPLVSLYSRAMATETKANIFFSRTVSLDCLRAYIQRLIRSRLRLPPPTDLNFTEDKRLGLSHTQSWWLAWQALLAAKILPLCLFCASWLVPLEDRRSSTLAA